MRNSIFYALTYYNQINKCRFWNNFANGCVTNSDYVCELVNHSVDSSNRLNPFAKECYKAIISLTKPKIILR